VYDEYKWQRDNNIHIDFPQRAEGLHRVLYQCPHCLTEHEMDSKDDELWCNHCNKHWKMDTLGELHAVEGPTEFHIFRIGMSVNVPIVRTQLELEPISLAIG
jgi:hypothetical protein